MPSIYWWNRGLTRYIFDHFMTIFMHIKIHEFIFSYIFALRVTWHVPASCSLGSSIWNPSRTKSNSLLCRITPGQRFSSSTDAFAGISRGSSSKEYQGMVMIRSSTGRTLTSLALLESWHSQLYNDTKIIANWPILMQFKTMFGFFGHFRRICLNKKFFYAFWRFLYTKMARNVLILLGWWYFWWRWKAESASFPTAPRSSKSVQ